MFAIQHIKILATLEVIFEFISKVSTVGGFKICKSMSGWEPADSFLQKQAVTGDSGFLGGDAESSGTEVYFLGGGVVVSSLRTAESTKMRKMGDDINILDLKYFLRSTKFMSFSQNTRKPKINYCNFLKSQILLRGKNFATTLFD
jgi:hypothetical protein